MSKPTRRRAWLVAIAALCVFFAPAAGAFADEDPTQNKDHNNATAVNTEDGASVFRFALSIQEVTDGVVDQTNTASAQASCVDCTTVALAFQVILVSGSAGVVVPENRAEAANVECAECITYAAATQLVIGMDGMELTDNGKRRLLALEKKMRDIEKNADNMTDAELLAAAQEAERELIAIFEEELVPIDGSGSSGTTTTTSTTSGGSTTTTTESTTTTSTTEPEATTTTQVAP